MRVLVCLKQVADPDVVEFDLGTGKLERLQWLVNPLDLVALEEALRLKETYDVSVAAATVGPSRAEAVLRQALTYGADRAVRVWDPSLEQADTYVVSSLLAAVAAKAGFDLILCGARSADSGSECLGAYLAEELQLPYITRAVALDCSDGAVTAHTRGERGWREEFHAPLPAIVAVEEGLNEPRYVPILSRVYRQGLGKSIEVWNLDDLEVGREELNPLVRALEVGQPRPRPKVGMNVSGLSMKEKLQIMRGQSGGKQRQLFRGSPTEAARTTLGKLEEWLR